LLRTDQKRKCSSGAFPGLIYPDFLRGLLALMNFMRLSAMKAAQAAVAGYRVQEIRTRGDLDFF
jgi:hypothetical protein